MKTNFKYFTRCIVAFCAATLLALGAQAQTMKKASATQSSQMIAAINKTASALKTVQCNFTQTKTMSFLKDKMVSRGKMYYTSSGQLRWQYTTPYQYTLVMNNGKVTINSAGKTSTVDLASNRLFQSIASIMVSSVTGKSLADTRDYTVQMYTLGNQWVATLTPRRGTMKKMFKTVRLYFNDQHSMVSKVEMTETSGDKTLITLENVKTNAPIPSSTFTVK